LAQVRFNETAMLMGIGGLAMGGLQILKLIGAKVIAVSRTESKLEMAKKFGADITINSTKTDVAQEVKRLTDGHGVDHVFDFVTTPETLDQGVRSTRPGGKVVFLGYSEPIPLNVGTIRFISLTSSRNGTRQNLRDLISLASEGKLKSPVTRTYRLDEATEALTALSKGEVTGRVVLQI
jgi:D-arabinose 1-dehydrogenase-like Zn-dependent alcohol dehydrogenase